MASRPSFEKMLNSSQNIVPKRLSFDFLNTSSGGNQSKKRKMDEDPSVFEVEVNHSEISKTLNSTLNSSSGSVTSMPWEVKILRIDLLESQSRVCADFLRSSQDKKVI